MTSALLDRKAVTRAVYEGIWTEHRVELIDELFAPEARLHLWGRVLEGRDKLHAAVEEVWLPAFPDLAATVHFQVAEADLVADYTTFTGTHTGAPIWGIPARGAAFSFTQSTTCRVTGDGKIVDMWEDWDHAGLLRQLGVTFVEPQ